jgi:hypothetical protein
MQQVYTVSRVDKVSPHQTGKVSRRNFHGFSFNLVFIGLIDLSCFPRREYDQPVVDSTGSISSTFRCP